MKANKALIKTTPLNTKGVVSKPKKEDSFETYFKILTTEEVEAKRCSAYNYAV